jgi:hypothetical protein
MPPIYLEPGQRGGTELQVISLRRRFHVPPTTAHVLTGFLFERMSA